MWVAIDVDNGIIENVRLFKERCEVDFVVGIMKRGWGGCERYYDDDPDQYIDVWEVEVE